jgi:hypothetical protein
LPFVTAILAAFIMYAVFSTGVRRGMDGAIALGESEQRAWAVAISELVYRLDSYVAHSAVVDTIIQRVRDGTTGPGDPNFAKNTGNPDLLNAAISAALSLGPQPEGFVSQRSLRTMVHDDIGIVDYDKIAFALFGFRVQSLYYFFFVVLSVSASVFLLQYWHRPMAQVVLLCNLVAFWLELHTGVFTTQMPSLWGMRHGSTLAILPAWHVALLMAYRTRLSWPAAILGLVQVAIIVFAIRICGSAAWSLIFLACLPAFFAFQFWRNSGPSARSVATFARAALKWPFVLLLVGLAANKLYTDGKLHPAYFTDDIMPYPSVWHAAYFGIVVSPTLVAATGDPKRAWGDATVYTAALRYLRNKGFMETEADYLSPWTHTYKMRIHDNTMRAVYLDLIKEYPFTTLGMYLYQKPSLILLVVWTLLLNIPLVCWLAVLLGAGAVAAITVMARAVTPAEVRNAAWLGFAAALFSSLTGMWSYPNLESCADLLVCTLVLCTLVIWALCERLLRSLSSRFASGGEARA